MKGKECNHIIGLGNKNGFQRVLIKKTDNSYDMLINFSYCPTCGEKLL